MFGRPSYSSRMYSIAKVLILAIITMLNAHKASSSVTYLGKVVIGVDVCRDVNCNVTDGIIYSADLPTTFSNVMDLEYSGFNLSDFVDTEELLPNYVDYDPLNNRFYFMERFGAGVSVDFMGGSAVFFAHDQGVRLFYASGFGELGHIRPDGKGKTILYVAPGSNPLLFNIAKYGDLVFVHEDLFNTEFKDYALSIISIPDKSLIEQRTGFATSDGEHEFWHTDRFRVRLQCKSPSL
ncbi:uncharacterized protein LOC121430288 [Lytechinus variegatus]|uniref:uncharacterized protein LOC121430288 n=1 Tax=Lytechinus variegatus TaxID=7654 RepID=UPI001BB103E6|nr:uncharacterized protein LOC121430288 [Lytechinus variegatus]